jgi:hypothetical protein
MAYIRPLCDDWEVHVKGSTTAMLAIAALPWSTAPMSASAQSHHVAVCAKKSWKYKTDKIVAASLGGAYGVVAENAPCTFDRELGKDLRVLVTKMARGSKLCVRGAIRLTGSPKGSATSRSVDVPFEVHVFYQIHEKKAYLTARWKGGFRPPGSIEGVLFGKAFIDPPFWWGFRRKKAEIDVYVIATEVPGQKYFIEDVRSSCPPKD